MIDTHSHIFVEEFDADRDAMMERAAKAGIKAFIMPCIDIPTLPRLLDCYNRYNDNTYPMLGIHPTEIRAEWKEDLQVIKDLLQNSPVPFVGVGEVGLDLYWDTSTKKLQIQVLDEQIRLALEYDKPLSIHCRMAYDELASVLDRYAGDDRLRGVFHCFSGNADRLERMLDFKGFMIGIGGTLTYKKSIVPSLLPSIPLDRILLETDCPYLAPVPFRGRRNEPAYMADTAQFAADLLGTDVEKLDYITTANAKRLFSLSE
ncbi:MAG: TatD family hydrolase [Bacteroidaceae bacterium]|nr:TatD family hydrolase [Bacteroidaceae bacterium]